MKKNKIIFTILLL